jgi:hypothetical protein
MSIGATPLDQLLDDGLLRARGATPTQTQREIDENITNPLCYAAQGTTQDFDALWAPLTAGNTNLGPVCEPELSLMTTIATTPVLTTHSMQTLFRCLRTWPRMIAKGILSPPIIHHTVTPVSLMPTALARCYTLVKMWDGQCPGTGSMVMDAIMKEVQTLMDTVR